MKSYYFYVFIYLYLLFEEGGAVSYTHTSTTTPLWVCGKFFALRVQVPSVLALPHSSHQHALALGRALRIRDDLDLFPEPSFQRGPALAEPSEGRPHTIAGRGGTDGEGCSTPASGDVGNIDTLERIFKKNYNTSEVADLDRLT